ncbi:MAG: amino acid permease [Microlunatus sp.]
MAATKNSVKLEPVLGLPSLTAYGLMAMGVGAVFTVYGATAKVSDGHVAGSYLVALTSMIFTAHSYARFAQAMPVAGSAYAYTSKSFGGVIGFFTGWTMLLDYVFLPMINFLLIGLYMNSVLTAVPPQVFVAISIVLVLIFNIVGVGWVGRLNAGMSIFGLLVGAVFVALTLVYVGGVRFSDVAGSIVPNNGIQPILAGAAVLALAFLGFDAISTLSEEAKNATRTVPIAIILSTLIVGLFAFLISCMAAMLFPNWHDIQNIDASGTEMMQMVGGVALMTVFLVYYVASTVLCGTAAQMGVSRILFAMGRDGVLPPAFSRLHRRFHTPYFATAVVSLFSLVALFITLDTAIYMINFGALVAFAMVNLGAFKYFIFDEKRRGVGALITYALLPLIGFGFTAWLWTSLAPFTFVLGGTWLALGVLLYGIRTNWFRQPPPAVEFDEHAAERAFEENAASGEKEAPQ